MIGLPVAGAAPAPQPRPSGNGTDWIGSVVSGTPAAHCASARPRPRVVDLSALWAGPLASHLLQAAGADVIKVEDIRRPDGARRGAADFYRLMNGGKRSVAVDFSSNEGRAALRRLVTSADIVIEGSRPRALRALGLDAEALVTSHPGLTWIGITGYGRNEPEAGWVAFGDDAAVSAGLATLAGSETAPVFCADAVADPLTGIHAALAALAFHEDGGGVVVDISLAGVAAYAGSFLRIPHATVRPAGADAWEVATPRSDVPVLRPCVRRSDAPAAPLGADTAVVLEEIDPC